MAAADPTGTMKSPEELQDDTAVDNERCGICTDIVIDRGVLDCCSHWFCFACIDNWATITNLCPLCKNEFQLITCLPVYDTIGNIKTEDYSFPRDDDWSIQGKNNTLSFPSYYIDEDAVVCLDSDGCKIRNGLSLAEEDLTFDTSIACDSCDIWYHACCVDFNPECGASESSWLCPRCISNEAQRKSDGITSKNLVNHSGQHADTEWDANTYFSSKVSVSVADAGETAVVVSMVEGHQKEEHDKISQPAVDIWSDAEEETGTFLHRTDFCDANLKVQPEHIGCNEVIHDSLICNDEKHCKGSALEDDKKTEMHFDTPEIYLNEKLLASPSLGGTALELNVDQSESDALQPSSIEDVSFPSCDPATDNDLKNNNVDGMTFEQPSSIEVEVPSALSCVTSESKSQISDINFHLDLSVSTSSVVDLVDSKCEAPENVDELVDSKREAPENVDELVDSKCRAPENVQKASFNNSEDILDISLKHIEVSDSAGGPTEKQQYESNAGCMKINTRKREMETQYPVKKAKPDGETESIPARSPVNASVLDRPKRCSRNVAQNDENVLRNVPRKKTKSPDIMSIVQEVDIRPNGYQQGTNALDRSTAKKENTCGPRVKKIMRRVGEKEESSILVQKLSKEIRQAVLDNAPNNNVNANVNDFDVKLLAAFKAAIVKPRNELVNKNVPSCGSLKKHLLTKGKTRENLTKKIYGTTAGKRKRAWDRDWEIEFWKHRCARNETEKAETLHSVLALLKKATNSSSDDTTAGEGPEGGTNSILSRVYLADNSVFPRKDDVKPLSVLAGPSRTANASSMEKSPAGISSCLPQVKAVSSNDIGKRSSTLSHVDDGHGRKDNSISDSSSSKGRVQGSSKEISGRSESSKIDKKKWALEVLARKKASISSNGSKGKEEDKSALKGNYPLLAQLPADMRPVPAPSSHNKVPQSVRQAQLHRIAEHYLRRTNLTIMRRTADTELAVADAVNIEKGIFERSNSKLVYINLCSQSLSQRSNKPSSAETTSFDNSAPTVQVTNHVVEETSTDASLGECSKVEEALKLAGLSDTPPNSPGPTEKKFDVEDYRNEHVEEQELENVLDIDSHPELDIYGDFEYDLEDEGHEVSNLLQRNLDSKLKVVLSTIGHDERSNVGNAKPNSSDSEVLADDQDKFKVGVEDSGENGVKEIKMVPSVVPKPFERETDEGPSLSEYEELYGPDNLVLTNETLHELTGEKSKSIDMVTADKSTVPYERGMHQSRDGAKDSEFVHEGCAEISFVHDGTSLNDPTSCGDKSPACFLTSENAPTERKERESSNGFPYPSDSIVKKVEAYVKEHIRPLCKSGVITVDQYRWAVGKTTDKVMKFHHKAKNANFLIKEGEKVKKLAEQYVEAAQQKDS